MLKEALKKQQDSLSGAVSGELMDLVAGDIKLHYNVLPIYVAEAVVSQYVDQARRELIRLGSLARLKLNHDRQSKGEDTKPFVVRFGAAGQPIRERFNAL